MLRRGIHPAQERLETRARIAGHSRISTTERYIHPQAEAILEAFEKIAEGQEAVTDGGHRFSPLTNR
jgi:hypothetical protein